MFQFASRASTSENIIQGNVRSVYSLLYLLVWEPLRLVVRYNDVSMRYTVEQFRANSFQQIAWLKPLIHECCGQLVDIWGLKIKYRQDWTKSFFTKCQKKNEKYI